MNDRDPLTPSATRALLAELGISPRRKMGQNFLIDGNLVRKSLELAGVSPGDRVVEVGPGLGTLTGGLLAAGAVVRAIELDRALASHLQQTFAAETESGQYAQVCGDAVDLPLAGWTDAPPTDGFKIVANLPYAISSPWLDAVLENAAGQPGIEGLPQRMVLMLQREAARRYRVSPGTKSFGAISVFLQAAYETGPQHSVSRHCFHPEPEVDSVLASYSRRLDPWLFSVGARRAIRTAFTRRRKQIKSLQRDLPEAGAWLRETAGIDGSLRPEEIPVAAWIALDVAIRQGAERTGIDGKPPSSESPA